jgi:hypothetical protein
MYIGDRFIGSRYSEFEDCGIEEPRKAFKGFDPPAGWDARSSSSMEKKPVLDAFGDDISQASGYGSFSKAVKKSKFKVGDRVRVRTPRSARGAISPSGEVGEVTTVDCNSESCAIRVHRPTGETWSIEDFLLC